MPFSVERWILTVDEVRRVIASEVEMVADLIWFIMVQYCSNNVLFSQINPR